MLNTIKKAASTLAIAGALVSLTACSGNNAGQVLKDANINIESQNGQKFVTWMNELDTKNLIISAATLPILKDGKELGKVEVVTDVTTAKAFLKVSFNLSSFIDIPLPQYSSVLPNGTTIPLTGIDLNRMMAFDVGSKGSKMYLYYDTNTKKSVVGVALNIESLSIGQPANVMALFNFNGLTGVAGLYFGAAQNQSGLAAFADLSTVFTKTASVRSMAAASDVNFYPLTPTPAQQYKIGYKLYQLGASGEVLVIK